MAAQRLDIMLGNHPVRMVLKIFMPAVCIGGGSNKAAPPSQPCRQLHACCEYWGEGGPSPHPSQNHLQGSPSTLGPDWVTADWVSDWVHASMAKSNGPKHSDCMQRPRLSCFFTYVWVTECRPDRVGARRRVGRAASVVGVKPAVEVAQQTERGASGAQSTVQLHSKGEGGDRTQRL